ncbi:MAG: hypothetical protein ACKOOL_09000 [Novosphingobium sp.]
MAQARATQQRHDAARPTQISPLADAHYSNEECRLWRWVDAGLDQRITSMVAEFAGLDEGERNALRDSLSMDDFYTILTFVRRCALTTLRSGKDDRIEPAFNALAMIALDRIDWRDLLVASRLAIYACQRVNASGAERIAQAARLAEPHTREALIADQNTEIDIATSCGYREVQTAEGPVLFGTSYEKFAPKADLAGIAFTCALALESNDYRIGGIELATDLPLTWLGSKDGSAIATIVHEFSGCISIHGTPSADPDPDSSGQSLLVFLAEAATESDALAVADAAEKSSDAWRSQIGIASGRLCAVVIQRSWMADTPPMEDVGSLARLRSVLERSIG